MDKLWEQNKKLEVIIRMYVRTYVHILLIIKENTI